MKPVLRPVVLLSSMMSSISRAQRHFPGAGAASGGKLRIAPQGDHHRDEAPAGELGRGWCFKFLHTPHSATLHFVMFSSLTF